MGGTKCGLNRDGMRRGRGARPGVDLSRMLGCELSDGRGRHDGGNGTTGPAQITKESGRGSANRGPRPLGVWARVMIAQPLPEGRGRG